MKSNFHKKILRNYDIGDKVNDTNENVIELVCINNRNTGSTFNFSSDFYRSL